MVSLQCIFGIWLINQTSYRFYPWCCCLVTRLLARCNCFLLMLYPQKLFVNSANQPANQPNLRHVQWCSPPWAPLAPASLNAYCYVQRRCQKLGRTTNWSSTVGWLLVRGCWYVSVGSEWLKSWFFKGIGPDRIGNDQQLYFDVLILKSMSSPAMVDLPQLVLALAMGQFG